MSASPGDEPPKQSKLLPGKEPAHGSALNTIAIYKYNKSPLRKHMLITFFLVMMATVLGSALSWWVTTLIGQSSLGILAQQFQEALGKQFSEATGAFFRPTEVFLKQGYEMSYLNDWDLESRAGQLHTAHFRVAFLEAYLRDARCCSGILTNMDYYGIDNATGEPNSMFGKSNENSYGNDLAAFSVTIASKFYPTEHRYGLYPGGNATNPWISERVDGKTGRLLNPDRFPWGDIHGRKNMGLSHWPRNHLAFRIVKKKHAKEGDYNFADLQYQPHLSALATTGVLGIIRPSCGLNPARKAGGMCMGKMQLRVGIWVVGINLILLMKYMASMELKGGFVFYIERHTGFFCGSNNLDMTVHREIKMPSGKTKYLPVFAAEADDPKVTARVKWMLSEREGKTITYAEVAPGTAETPIGSEGDQFVYVNGYLKFGTDWIGCATVPWSRVMEDLDSTKYKMLVVGMALAMFLKGALQTLAGFIAGYFHRTVIIPSMKKAVEADIDINEKKKTGGVTTAAVAGGAAVGVAGAALAGLAVANMVGVGV